MDYPTPEKQTQRPEPPRRQTLSEWVTDVCRVKATTPPYPAGTEVMTGCVDGLVHPEVRGYTVAFKCPMCDRAKERFPEKIKTWRGACTLYTDEEYRAILASREDRADQIRRGASRAPELDTEGIGS
jgi:hypothetical protein